LPPQIVKPKAVVSNGRILDIIYEVRFKGDEDPVGVPADEMFHIKGKGGDWLAGCSIIEHAQRVFSNAVMTDQYAESFYGNGSLLSGVLKTDKRLDEKTAGALKNRWRQKVQGIDNAFDIVVLDSGTDFQPITVNPQDAQFLEARRFNVEEIARMFGVPKELLGENGAAPIDPEKAGILFVTFTLSDWKKRIESAASRQILGSSHSASLQFTDLVVADERTRSSAAVMWRTAQILSINELRVREGLPPIEESDADDPMYVAEGKDATTPGTNQGKQEQPVPADQAPADQPLGDNNA
jgi:HK97 family phage portal protein